MACYKPLRNVGNALFIGVLAALLPYYTYVCACATRFAVCCVCVMRAMRVSDESDESDDGAQAAYVVAWEEERVMDAAVFRHTENAVGMI